MAQASGVPGPPSAPGVPGPGGDALPSEIQVRGGNGMGGFNEWGKK